MRLRHEVWKNPEDGSFAFSLASQGHDELRAKIAPRSELLHVIYAASLAEAMDAYYAWQGWGAWKPTPGDDEPYDNEWLRIQQIVISRS